jgi:hypothetical protein
VACRALASLLALGLVLAGASACGTGELANSTISATPRSECGRTPGTAGTWRPSLGYCEY